MATYYVRTDGNDSNTGTGATAATAWKTLTKALGTSGIGNGDTVWIAPGRYEYPSTLTIQLTSPTVETFISGDPLATKFPDIQAGVVLVTNTSDDTTQGTLGVLGVTNKNNLTISDITFSGQRTAAAYGGVEQTNGTNVKWQRCVFESTGQYCFVFNQSYNTSVSTTFYSCVFKASGAAFQYRPGRGNSGNYRMGVTLYSCLFLGYVHTSTINTGTGTNTGTGGFNVYNCTFMPGGFEISNTDLNDTANPCIVRNCIFWVGYPTVNNVAFRASYVGTIDEDYNRIATGTRINVTAGTNSKYVQWGFDVGDSFAQNMRRRVVGSPSSTALIGQGTSTGAPTLDLYGKPFASPPSIGAVEFGDIAGSILTHPGTAGGMRG